MLEEEIKTEDNNAEESAINLHSIFNKMPEVEVAQVNEAPKKKEPVKKAAPIKVEATVEKDDEDEDETPAPSKSKEDSKAGEVDYKAELEKIQKTLKDTQRSFHEDRKKLATYRKTVEKFKEQGTLLDEEATLLLDHTQFEEEPQEESEYLKFHKVWTNELTQMRKYAPNPGEVDQHFHAFQHFVQTATAQELQDAFSELKQYEDDEVEFTRQMLEIGRQYNHDVYSDIHEAGSIRQLKTKYAQRESELQNKFDKLEKKYNKLKEKYEDFDTEPGNYNLPTGAGNHELPKNTTFDPKQIFAKQFQRR